MLDVPYSMVSVICNLAYVINSDFILTDIKISAFLHATRVTSSLSIEIYKRTMIVSLKSWWKVCF